MKTQKPKPCPDLLDVMDDSPEETPIKDQAAIDELFELVESSELLYDFGKPIPMGQHNKISMPIKILPHGESLPLPEYKTELASGFDICAANDAPIFLNSIGAAAMVPTGISIAVPEGFEAQIRPRSGLAAKHGITVTNTPGTIDADYRGEIKVLLTNLSGRRFTIERGMRIAQVVICPVYQADLVVVEEHNQTQRGEGGFGSTGV